MFCRLSDEDEKAMRQELAVLEDKLSQIAVDSYENAMKCKFLRHRIANLYYMLQNPGMVII